MNVIGASRPYAIARYLADRGNEVTVLCAGHTRFAASTDVDLENIRVIRVRVPRVALALEPSTAAGLVRRTLNGVARQLFVPDPFVMMQRSYIAAARQAFSDAQPPQVIISSALPFSLHTTATALSRRWSCRWIADNRDLWARSPYRRRASLLRRWDVAYQRKVLKQADVITAVGSVMAEELMADVGGDSTVRVIRNGADVSLPAVPSSGIIDTIVYTGVLYGARRNPRPVLDALMDSARSYSVQFYGAEYSAVEKLIKEYPSLNISWHKPVSRHSVKEIQRRAAYLLLALGTQDFEKGVLTGKFFEYVESRRPILAVCAADSELAQLIDQHQLGVAATTSHAFASFLESRKATSEPLPPVPYELTRLSQLERFEQLLG